MISKVDAHLERVDAATQAPPVARVRVGLVVGVLLLLGAASARAADQLILGQKLHVRNTATDVAKRRVLGQAREKQSGNTIAGDPTVSGATLEVIANGHTDSHQIFNLPALGWRRLGTAGFKFTNRATGGAARTATVKRTGKGLFQIRVQVDGKGGFVYVVPPDPGDDGGFILTLGGGDRYCVGFGASAGGREVKDAPGQWLIKNATGERCPIPAGYPTPTATPTLVPGTATATSTFTAGGSDPTATATPGLSCGSPPPPDPPMLPDDDPFYDAPTTIAEPPGTVLKSRQIALAALDANATTPFESWQVMYASTDANGEAAAAVATIIVPCTAAATSPRPLVSYQTAEDSDALRCAPSYTMRLGTEKEEVSLPPLLANGWVVVVPDYEGLQSAYTVGVQAGQGVLDGIRAAENFGAARPQWGLTGAATPVGLWGYSGGGLATAWTAELQPTYAPELNLVGVSAGGVPPDIAAIADNLDGGPFSAIMLAGTIGQSQAHPELLPLVNDDPGQAMREYFLHTCIGEYLVSQYAFQSLDTYTTVPNAIALPFVQEILARSHLGNVCSTAPYQPCLADGDCGGGGTCRRKHPAVPMYVFHAVNDELIPVAGVSALVSQYCAEGVPVTYYQDAASDHVSLAFSGAPAAIQNLALRFAGQTLPSTCGLPTLP